MIEEARCQFLVAKIYQTTKEGDETLEALLKARELQSKYANIFAQLDLFNDTINLICIINIIADNGFQHYVSI